MRLKLLAIGIVLMMTGSTLLATGKINNNNAINTEKEHYYSYNELTDLLVKLKQEYPEIFNYSSLGKTWEGRDIWLVKISDKVTVDENQPELLYMGGEHGDEKQTYQVVIYSIKTIVENYTYINVNMSYTERIRNVVNNTELFFMPMVNPDGCVDYTRKNARQNKCPFGSTLFRGVDVNRNSGYKWELLDQYPIRYRFQFPYIEKINVKYPFFDTSSAIRGEGQYRGPYPFSEPESKAIRKVIENQTIKLAVNYHAASNKVMYGWAWKNDDPIENESLLLSIAQNVSNMAGCDIKKGSVALVLGSTRDWLSSKGILNLAFELPPTRGDRPLLHIIHQNGNPLPWKNTPILQLCETYALVNLYFAERAMSITG